MRKDFEICCRSCMHESELQAEDSVQPPQPLTIMNMADYVAHYRACRNAHADLSRTATSADATAMPTVDASPQTMTGGVAASEEEDSPDRPPTKGKGSANTREEDSREGKGPDKVSEEEVARDLFLFLHKGEWELPDLFETCPTDAEVDFNPALEALQREHRNRTRAGAPPPSMPS